MTPDIDRQIHEQFKGKFRYFGCLECGKKTLLGNLAQRVRERNMPVCHSKSMLLVKTAPEHDHIAAAMKHKRGERLDPVDVEALRTFLKVSK